MNKLLHCLLFSSLVLMLLSGCAEMEAKRAEAVRAQIQQFQGRSLAPWTGNENCTDTLQLDKRKKLVFTQNSIRFRLPNQVDGVAYCFRLPLSTAQLEFKTNSVGGLTYELITSIYPSILFLDQNFQIKADISNPKANWDERWNGTSGLTGDILFNEERPTFVVIYLDSSKFGGNIPVVKGGASVTVIAGAPIPSGYNQYNFSVPMAPTGEMTVEVKSK